MTGLITGWAVALARDGEAGLRCFGDAVLRRCRSWLCLGVFGVAGADTILSTSTFASSIKSKHDQGAVAEARGIAWKGICCVRARGVEIQ